MMTKDTGQLTEYKNKKETMDTEYGIVTAEKWCMLEAERINMNPYRKVYIKENERGFVCLWENIKRGR
jgi:hypothetical protein